MFVGGPFGPFFRHLASLLREEGAAAVHINMHAGDLLDWGFRHKKTFRGRQSEWKAWIGAYLTRSGATDLVCYGDCGHYVRYAIEAAQERELRVHVFELGYFRPDWVTLERDGVNDYSPLPRDPAFYHGLPNLPKPPAKKVGLMMPFHATNTIWHCIAYYLGGFLYPRFEMAWPTTPAEQAFGYIGRLFRSWGAGRQSRALERHVLSGGSPFFLCALQKPGDWQIKEHSNYDDLAPFIDEVVDSFAAHAPPDTLLVFKAHPLDNGAEPHAETIIKAATRHQLGDRLLFLSGGSLSDLTKAARGVVTINSTAGLAAIDLGRPTIALGRAIYNIPGITHQGGLDDFWTRPEGPDQELFAKFHHYVLMNAQINGSFYAPKGRKMALPEAARRLLADEAK